MSLRAVAGKLTYTHSVKMRFNAIDGRGEIMRIAFMLKMAAGMLALGFGLTNSSHAARYIGAWDPAYGYPFALDTNALFWSGSAIFDIGDGCVLDGKGLASAGGTCFMTVSQAKVELAGYDTTATPDNLLGTETLYFGETLSITQAQFVGKNLVSVSTNGFFTPKRATYLSAAGGNESGGSYDFTLSFFHSGARLYHSFKDGFPKHTGHDDSPEFWNGLGNGHWVEDCREAKKNSRNQLYCGASKTDAVVEFALLEVPEPQTYLLSLLGMVLLFSTSRGTRVVR